MTIAMIEPSAFIYIFIGAVISVLVLLIFGAAAAYGNKYCPRCGSEDVTAERSGKTYINVCVDCGTRWTIKNTRRSARG